MGRLDPEARMTIKTLAARGTTRSDIARLLGVTEGAVRHHLRRMAAGVADGRSLRPMRAESQAGAIEHWRSQQGEGAVNLAALHAWLRRGHGYEGSLRSVQRYWRRACPVPAVRARRRVETPAGAQARVDWAHFPGLLLGEEVVDLVALHMVLSWSRREAIVWSRGRDALPWQSCHTGCFARPGGVPAAVRVDNERTAVVRGAGPWGTINAACRRYATVMRFHVDACAPRQPQAKGKVERRVRDQRQALDPRGQVFADLAALQAWTDRRLEELAGERRCPASGTSVAEAWARERALPTPLPEPPPEPFDVVVMRPVGRDGLVCFEGRQYSVPFRLVGERVEVRGAAGAVQILKACAEVARHPRGTDRRLVVDPRHYDGPGTGRVVAPAPLGRMGRRLREPAEAPVMRRSIEPYAAPAEVAR